MPVSSEWLNVAAKLLRMMSLATGRTALADPAHPRSRGEHFGRRAADRHEFGSSPLAWGTPPCMFPGHCRKRLIPARAGNTASLLGHGVGCHALEPCRLEYFQPNLPPLR